MSRLTRTDQKFLSFTLSSLWKLMPGFAGLSCRSKAVVLTAFCSSPVSRAKLSVKVSAMRKSIFAPCPSNPAVGPGEPEATNVIFHVQEIQILLPLFYGHLHPRTSLSLGIASKGSNRFCHLFQTSRRRWIAPFVKVRFWKNWRNGTGKYLREYLLADTLRFAIDM